MSPREEQTGIKAKFPEMNEYFQSKEIRVIHVSYPACGGDSCETGKEDSGSGLSWSPNAGDALTSAPGVVIPLL